MRGKVCNWVEIPVDFGITPAYAGKSPQLMIRNRRTIGSPPPMRGKAADLVTVYFDIGITPAYAGKRPAEPRPKHKY